MGIALAATMAIVAISFVIQPVLWGRWWEAILSHVGSTGPAAVGLPLAARLPVAAALVVFAAKSDRRWLVPVAAFLAMPWIYLQSFVILLAIVRLLPTTRGSRWSLEPPSGRGDIPSTSRLPQTPHGAARHH